MKSLADIMKEGQGEFKERFFDKEPYLFMGDEMCDFLASFAQKVVEGVRKEDAELLEYAWGIIANASGSDWGKESEIWQKAAAKWRGQYFARLAQFSGEKKT